MPQSLAAERKPLLVVALLASLLVHAVAVALAPQTKALVAAASGPLEMVVVQTVKPALPAPVQAPEVVKPRPALRAPRAAKAAAPVENTVRDLEGEAPAPAAPEPPPLVFQLPLAPPPTVKASPAAETAGPPPQTEAKLESEVTPAYPEAARREDVEGVVVLRVTVGEDGHVVSAVIVEDPGAGLGEAARAAVMRARFAPATRGAARVRTTFTWRYRFELR